MQAEKFGTEMAIPVEAVGIDCKTVPFGIMLSDGRTIRTATVVVASGARYRRPDVPHLGDFEGRGVWYWASPIEARLCRQEEIVLIGGGNSAGQAAVFLRQFAAKIWMLVRSESIAENMSQYLVDRIEATNNIEVLTQTEVVVLSGSREGQLERVRWRHNPTGEETEKRVGTCSSSPAQIRQQAGWRAAASNWTTGNSSGRARPAPRRVDRLADGCRWRPAYPGVFAIGDVRSGSVKRVGAAVGEGAAVIQQVHSARAKPAITLGH